MNDGLGRLMDFSLDTLDEIAREKAQRWIEPELPQPRYFKPPNLLPVYIKGMPVAYQNYEAYRIWTPWGWIECPLGLICDGASVPRPLWWKYPPDGLYRAAALPHDWTFANGGNMPATEHTPALKLTFEQCNDMMLWVMKERCEGLDNRDIHRIYDGVSSCFGRRAFKKSARLGPRIEPLRYQIS